MSKSWCDKIVSKENKKLSPAAGMGSRAGSREPEPKGFSGFGAEPRAEKFYRLRLSARLSALFILQNNWFLEKLSIKSNKSQIIGAVKIFFRIPF